MVRRALPSVSISAQGVGEGHVAVGEMVAVGFAVGRDVHQLVRGRVLRGKAPINRRARFSPLLSSRSNATALAGARVIKENGDGAAGRQFHQIGHGGVHQAAIDILPDLRRRGSRRGWPERGRGW